MKGSKATHDMLNYTVSSRTRASLLCTPTYHKRNSSPDPISLFIDNQKRYLQNKIINLAILRRDRDQKVFQNILQKPSICQHSKEILRTSPLHKFNILLGNTSQSKHSSPKHTPTLRSPQISDDTVNQLSFHKKPIKLDDSLKISLSNANSPKLIIMKILKEIEGNRASTAEISYEEFVKVLAKLSIVARDGDELFLQNSLWDLIRKQSKKDMAEIMYSIIYGQESHCIHPELAADLHHKYYQLFLRRHTFTNRAYSSEHFRVDFIVPNSKSNAKPAIKTHIKEFIKSKTFDRRNRSPEPITSAPKSRQSVLNTSQCSTIKKKAQVNNSCYQSLYQKILSPNKIPNVIGFERAVNRVHNAQLASKYKML